MAANKELGMLTIGKVLRGHGIRGELKILPESDDPARLLELEEVFVGVDENSSTLYKVESARLQQSKKGVVVLMFFAGVKGRDSADALRHQLLFASKDQLPPLEEGEFFLHELIGSKVETDTGELVGTLREIVELPAYNLYVIKRAGQKDALIPAVPEFIETIDVDAQIIVIRPIEGLLDV
ncbi:MAG: ribosome maturation factor RimM [Rhodothermales bacterium]